MTPLLTALPRAILTAGAAMTLAGCTGAMTDTAASPASTPAPAGGMSAATPVAQAMLRDASGQAMGLVTLTPAAAGLNGRIDVRGISPGPHGMHIHAVGKCDAPDFATAGGHLNPAGMKHGLSNPAGPHQGDLPQLTAGADGTAMQSFTANSSAEALFDADGAAFIVHAGPDDQMTDPSGNSGGRILCGVLTQPGY